MTGFDKWTSKATPELIASMIANLPPAACLVVCPLANGLCKHWPKFGNKRQDCQQDIKKYFESEVDEDEQP